MSLRPFLLVFVLALLPVPAVAANAADAAARLHDLFDREWEERLQEDPLHATAVGRHDYDDRLPAVAPEDLARRAEAARGFLRELAAVDRGALSPDDAASYDTLKKQLEDRVADIELGKDQMPFNTDSGFHVDFSLLPDSMPFATVQDYERYIHRLQAWPRYVDQQIAEMRLGLRRGMSVPREVLGGYEATFAVHVVDDPAKSVFWRPFDRIPAAVPDADRERLRREGREAVLQGAVAGYRQLLTFFVQEYLPQARKTLGASDLPNGKAYYAQQIREYTTLDRTAEDLHKLGLAEVDRISREMNEVMRQTGFQGSFPEFLQFLRTDPRFYAKTPQALLEHAAWIAKRIDGKLPSLIRTLPRVPYTVEPVPDSIAPRYTTGRYVEPAEGSAQPGIFWVNTYKLESRPLYDIPALACHEAVPGHHIQITRAREMTGLPVFRRFAYFPASGEGWGLYSEWLCLEAGIYDDPYDNFGRLTYEMWRACRLVVDTGVHAFGWTRRQALDYLASHTALPLHEVETEVDRYISFPGQALAFKVGELKIKELRRRAEKALGPRFDRRDFHDVILGSGSVPLKVLEDNVDRWIARQGS